MTLADMTFPSKSISFRMSDISSLSLQRNLSARELAAKADIGFSTLIRLESESGVPSSNVRTLEAIKKAFEDAGIEFIGTPEFQAGVRWRR